MGANIGTGITLKTGPFRAKFFSGLLKMTHLQMLKRGIPMPHLQMIHRGICPKRSSVREIPVPKLTK
jgi:hypothetical protein